MNGRNKAMCYTKDIHSYRKFSRNQSKEGISMSSIETFLQMVKESDNIVFFGGAGVSTESGIPDFRSVDGLYNQKYDYPPETILSHSFYVNHTEEFYRFYRDKMLCLTAKPNTTHYKLAELEKAGKLKAVVTQNIDGLIRRPEAKMFWNYTAAFTETIAENVERNLIGVHLKFQRRAGM